MYLPGERIFFLVHKFLNLKFAVEWISALRNNIEITFTITSITLLALMQLLKNNQMQFVCLQCCVWPHFVVQRNNLFSLVQFSSLIYKRRGKTLISKANKHKLNNSSKIQIAFFYPKNIQVFFGKLSILSKIWKWRK